MQRKYSRQKMDDITIVGLPIGKLDRITPETLRVIKKARVILDLTSSLPLLKRFCKNVIDLDPDYWTGEEDAIVYKRIANKVLDQARTGPGVVLVVDGHPGIYQDLSWDIYDRGRRRALRVTILPAISFLDLMIAFCNLRVDASGLQILEATSIVAYKHRLNPQVDTLVMQIGWFGTSLLFEVEESNKERFAPLIKYLRKYYPDDHIIKLIRAPRSARERPTIISSKLSAFDRFSRRITTDMTMLIPAVDSYSTVSDNEFVRKTTDAEHVSKIGRLSRRHRRKV
jgi:tetrapyrrole methylase family protein / MazG family protein